MAMSMGQSPNNLPENAGLNDQDVQLCTPETWRRCRQRFKRGGEEKVERRKGKEGDRSKVGSGVARKGKEGKSDDCMPSLEGVVDFGAFLLNSQQHNDDIFILPSSSTPSSISLPVYEGPLLGLKSRPGFIHAPGALSKELQLTVAALALRVYSNPPHLTNVDAHRHRSKLPKLAWASVGYHFDWTHRTYRDEMRSLFPPELAQLTSAFARAIGCFTYTAQAAIINFYRRQGCMGAHVDDSEDDEKNPVVSISLGLPAIFLVGTSCREEEPVPVLLRPGDVMMLSGNSRLCFHGVAGILPSPVPLPLKHKEGEYDSGELVENRYIEKGKENEQKGDEEEEKVNTNGRLHAYELKISDLPLMEKYRGIYHSDTQPEEVSALLSTHRVNLNVRQVLIDGATKLLQREVKEAMC